MALLESIKIPLGTIIPDFELKDPFGKSFKSTELFGERGLLVVFTCNHCPYAQALWPRIIRLAQYGLGMRVNTVAINPNLNPEYPEDAPDQMIVKIEQLGIDFPYLIDQTQKVADSFRAQCTPDIYLFDKKKALVYHGRIDDNWQDEDAVTKEELKEAMNNMAAGRPIAAKQIPSLGCSIKWNS